MIKVEIAGGAGYTAGELLRLLLHHREAEITAVASTSQAGEVVSKVYQDITATALNFTATLPFTGDVLFLCMGHGRSREFLSRNNIPESMKIIDLSQDFRLQGQNTLGNRVFVYGLPEANKGAIRQATSVANPGCFATAIQEALLPLAAAGWLAADVHINAITGATGAGQAPTGTTHFSWRHDNVSIYKPFTHQHLQEVKETLTQLAGEWPGDTLFIPVRGNFTRGIFASIYTRINRPLKEIKAAYREYFAGHPFVQLAGQPIHLKQAVNTNNVWLHVEAHGEYVLITSTIDNLLKGASGQAVQNMNLMFGIKETSGLQLKGSAF